MAHDVFISYSSKDKLAADAACAVLEAKGVRCWIAPRDIMPGADWSESIVDALGAARAFVLVFSANANASPQIKREVERAVNRGIAVIPVRIENVAPARSLEFFINTPHWLDAFTPPLEQHLNYLGDVILHILQRAPPPAPLAAPPPRWRLPKAMPWIAAACAALIVLVAIGWRTFSPGGGAPADGGGIDSERAEVVRQFYADLSRGDGTSAAELVVPAKRLKGPLSASAMTGFYSALRAPLQVLKVEEIPDGRVMVRYMFSSSLGHICDGAALVTVVRAETGALLIQKITAPAGC